MEAERKEAEAIRAEKDKARNIKNFIFLRLVKSLLQSQKQVETAKQLLVNHKGFSVQEAFRLFDLNQDGNITLDEIKEVLDKHNIDTSDFDVVLSLFDDNGSISYNQFEGYVTPIGHYNRHPALYEGTFEQRETQKLSWLESLQDVFLAISFASK